MARFLFYDDQIMNILQLHEKPSGGAAVQAYGWIRGLKQAGHEVYILTNVDKHAVLKEECRDLNMLSLYDPKKGIRWLRWIYYRLPYIYNKIKKVKPDYVYQGIPGWASYFIGLICQYLDIKYMLRISNDNLLDERILRHYSLVHKYFLELGIKKSYCILCQNSYQLTQINKKFPSKLAIKIPNPVFVNITGGVKKLGKRSYIAWIGLFQYQKNLKQLYEIALLLKNEDFKVAGKALPKIDDESKLYLHKLQELPNVEFVGFLSRNEVLPFLAKSKFLLNTSHYEGFSNTFLEAMTVATPIMSSKNVNPDEFITANHLGLVYRDAQDLLHQYTTLPPDVYETISANALNYVLQNHDYVKLTQKLLSFLNPQPLVEKAYAQ